MPKESPFLLNCFNFTNNTLDECIEILINFNNIPICKRIKELSKKDNKRIEKDINYEIKEKDKEIEKLTKKLKN